MKLSSQEEYGLRCLVQLGRQGEGGSLTIGELSQLEGISAPNVAKIMRVLRRAGLVTSTRGQAGGYALAQSPEQVVVGEALAVLGGRLFDARFCDRHTGSVRICTHLTDCSIRPVWRQVQDVVDEVLNKLTLKQLLGREQEVEPFTPGPRAMGLPLAARPS